MPPLHFHDELTALHLDLLIFHALSSLLHLIDLFLVARLLCLPLLPFLVSNTCHDLHRFLLLLLLLFHLPLVVIFNFLLVRLSLLLDKTLLQPVFEGLVALLRFDFLMESLSFLLTQHLLFFEGFAHELLLLPLVHAMCSLLVLFVQCSLLHDHFFKEVPLGFEDEHLAETLLMLLDAKPIIVTHLTFGNLLLIMAVHVQHRLVNISHLRLIGIVIALEMNLMLGIVGIEVRLGSFVQAL